MIVLSDKEIRSLLPMSEAIEIVEKAMIAVSEGAANLPLRSAIDVGAPNKMGVMPGALMPGNGRIDACFGVKLVSLFPGNPDAGYSSHQGAVVLFEPEHGSAVAMMNAGLLTAIRTAAASAVATRALARPDCATLAMIGAGEQAEQHLEAMLRVRPTLRELRVAGRRREKAEAFAAHAAEHYPALAVRVFDDVRSAVEGADLVCTVTSSAEPVLMGEWIAPGTHLNVVGASIPSKREIDEETVVRSKLYVDYRPSTFAQAGEVIGAIESGRIGREHVRAEIGEVLAGNAAGRTAKDEITLYRSLGVAAQDLACASHCLREAKARGLGIEASLD
ncbi:ornithine cyclodeaminase family protein [Microvirga mediterraneensis]|uniref:Ornithine cyclodeaminase family protein n=1 Tax=Microvirga mediterraneensis TaxID=2754695 RepID=A0A838BQ08_9HYPH|nr:ornithine cyclodeaminase family protein [Microvirga mediterraneensis]MBA1157627.1 ornithine cyclodeaminase family protein [Microvirga mediterraneensis]